MCSKYFQLFWFFIIASSLIIFGCTSDESYDNSDFVSEVNTALPDNSNTVPFVVVGSSGSIYTSFDGISWINKTIENETNDLRVVTYGDGIFVALAGHDTIYYSTDANNWTKTSSGGNSRIYDVEYGNGVFVAVSASGYVARSTDGKLWSNISATGGDTKAITFGNNLFYTHTQDDKSYFFRWNVLELANRFKYWPP